MRRSRGRIAAGPWKIAVAAGLIAASPLVAQVPTPPAPRPAPQDSLPRDTIPRDTIPVVRGDSVLVPIPPQALPADTAPAPRDTVPLDLLHPPPLLPPWPTPAPVGFGAGRWVWTQTDLQRFQGLSLLDVLVRVPGLGVTRAGVFGQPAGIGAWGGGGGRVRIFLDGYELDPLASATLDVQRLALVDLREVRVERGLLETRIEIETFRLDDSRPFSEIEGVLGNDRTRGLRAIFARPLGARDAITLGFDLVDSEGLPLREPYTGTTGLARWTHEFSPRAGVQLEYRQTGIDRPKQQPFGEAATYQDVIARLRARPAGALSVEATVGRSRRTPEEGDSLRIDAVHHQAALRTLLGGHRAWVEGIGRVRFGERGGYPAPSRDFTVRAGVEPFRGLGATGSVRHATIEGGSGFELAGGVRLGPAVGISLFAQGATGTRGIGVRNDSITPLLTGDGTVVFDTTMVFPALTSTARGLRAGAEWAGRGMTIGGAFIRLEDERIVPFGLQFDALVPPLETAAPARLVEGYLSAPLFYPPLRVEAAYTHSLGALPEQPYLPARQLRAALAWHDLFYDGELEPTARVEIVHRGSALGPVLGAESPGFVVRSDPYTLVNAYLQIRVLDVRAFVLLENAFNLRSVADVPGRPIPGQRAYYGVRWHFFN